jgi:hypothetical protein
MDRILTEKEFDEAWYKTEHNTVFDRKMAALKAQDAKTANYYETVIIPQKAKEAEKKLIKEIRAALWICEKPDGVGCTYTCQECNHQSNAQVWQQLKQSRGIE